MLWRNDYKNEYEGNRKLKEELEKERLFKEWFKDAADKNQKLIAIQHNKIEELEKENKSLKEENSKIAKINRWFKYDIDELEDKIKKIKESLEK
jgi:hypothetical protein